MLTSKETTQDLHTTIKMEEEFAETGGEFFVGIVSGILITVAVVCFVYVTMV